MISVIIPAYNAEAFLRECLDSVLFQDYTDWEAIVVDDGSTDLTAEIARGYAGMDKRFRIISVSNKGVSAARNLALDNSQGDWITYLDADDTLYPGALTALFDASQGVDIVEGASFRGKSQVTVKGFCVPKQQETLDSPTATRRLLYQHGKVDCSAWGKLYRSEFVKSFRFTEGIRYEDLEFGYRTMAASSAVRLIPTPVYFYRENPGSFINTFSPSRLDVLKVTRWIEEDAAQNHPELLAAARDRRLSACFNMFCLLGIHAPEHPERAECWQVIKERRLASLLSPRVRLKNRLGALLSYLGPAIFTAIGKRVYR